MRMPNLGRPWENHMDYEWKRRQCPVDGKEGSTEKMTAAFPPWEPVYSIRNTKKMAPWSGPSGSTRMSRPVQRGWRPFV